MLTACSLDITIECVRGFFSPEFYCPKMGVLIFMLIFPETKMHLTFMSKLENRFHSAQWKYEEESLAFANFHIKLAGKDVMPKKCSYGMRKIAEYFGFGWASRVNVALILEDWSLDLTSCARFLNSAPCPLSRFAFALELLQNSQRLTENGFSCHFLARWVTPNGFPD